MLLLAEGILPRACLELARWLQNTKGCVRPLCIQVGILARSRVLILSIAGRRQVDSSTRRPEASRRRDWWRKCKSSRRQPGAQITADPGCMQVVLSLKRKLSTHLQNHAPGFASLLARNCSLRLRTEHLRCHRAGELWASPVRFGHPGYFGRCTLGMHCYCQTVGLGKGSWPHPGGL